MSCEHTQPSCLFASSKMLKADYIFHSDTPQMCLNEHHLILLLGGAFVGLSHSLLGMIHNMNYVSFNTVQVCGFCMNSDLYINNVLSFFKKKNKKLIALLHLHLFKSGLSIPVFRFKKKKRKKSHVH